MIKKSEIKYFLIILLIIFNFQHIGCSLKSTPHTLIDNKTIYYINFKTPIFTVLPKITYERKDTGEEISVAQNDVNDLGEWISKISKEEIQSKGLLISKDIEEENKNQFNLVTESLLENSDQLVRHSPKDRYLDLMKSICDNKEISAVLVQYIRVKVGDDAELKTIILPPIFVGASPRFRQSSTFFKSVIRECSTGNILWESECFIRELPNPQSESFEAAIRSHFLNLTIKEK